jgi:hypothetical protein
MFVIIYIIFLVLLSAWLADARFIFNIEGFKKELLLLKSAKKLEENLQNTILQSNIRGVDLSKEQEEIPLYKFYTELILTLLHQSRIYGTPILKPLQEVRRAINLDRQLEQKLRSATIQSLLQFGLLILIVWVFIVISQYSTGIKAGALEIIIIIALQALGIGCFSLIFFYLRFNTFKDFSRIFECLYKIATLLDGPLSLKEVLVISKTENLDFVTSSSGKDMVTRLKYLIDNHKKTGAPIKTEIQLLISETQFSWEEAFKKFIKKIELMKLSIMFIFLVPSYFVFLYSIMRTFIGDF